MMTTFALVGALYGSVKALAQSRVRLLLAYGSFSLFSILWWFVAASRTVTPQAAVFLSAVALVTSGPSSPGRSFVRGMETTWTREPSAGLPRRCRNSPSCSHS